MISPLAGRSSSHDPFDTGVAALPLWDSGPPWGLTRPHLWVPCPAPNGGCMAGVDSGAGICLGPKNGSGATGEPRARGGGRTRAFTHPWHRKGGPPGSRRSESGKTCVWALRGRVVEDLRSRTPVWHRTLSIDPVSQIAMVMPLLPSKSAQIPAKALSQVHSSIRAPISIRERLRRILASPRPPPLVRAHMLPARLFCIACGPSPSDRAPT
jgi:hypothetical protein